MFTIICHICWTTPCIKQPCPVIFESCCKCWWLGWNNYSLAIDKLDILTWLKRLTVSKATCWPACPFAKPACGRTAWFGTPWTGVGLSPCKDWLCWCFLNRCRFNCWCVILKLTCCKCCCNFFFSCWTTINGFKKSNQSALVIINSLKIHRMTLFFHK